VRVTILSTTAEIIAGFVGVAVRRAREIVLIGVLLGSWLGALGAESSGSEKDKSLPENGLVGRMRQEEEAKRKQAETNGRAFLDPDAAQKELENLNNTFSNAVQMAEQTRRAEEASGGVFRSVIIGAVLLGAGIFLFRRFGPQLGFLHRVAPAEVYVAAANSAEEKSFADFVAAFKVGPIASDSPKSAGDSMRAELPKVDGGRTSTPAPREEFFDTAPKSVIIMRGLIQEITRAAEAGARQELLVDLREKIGSLKSMAGLQEVLPVWQLAAALEGLVRQLSEKSENVTPSTLRTVASAVDLLESLSAPGVRADLMSNPPIKLLAVDDEPLSRHAVTFALKKALNKPDLAENGEAAMALVSNIRYDAVFLDVQMPGMDGFETCTEIRRTELNRSTPVVFVTSQSDFDARAKSTLSGGMELIGKPFLTFEITVKALTLAFRGRLNRPNDFAREAATKASAETIELSADVIAKAFYTHAPEHVRTLRTRFEQVQMAKVEERQEHLVDLYLVVHSFRAEAELANVQPVVQLSGALEARLKKAVEEPANCVASTLEIIGRALDLLGDIFASKAGADLASNPAMQNVIPGQDLEALVLALRSLLKVDKEEVAAAKRDALPALDIVAAGK
jgi:DNA-binding response OmpR family regulator